MPSQACQDEFVLWALNQTEPDTFIELGSSDGFTINNSLALEQKGWEGLMVELEPKYRDSLSKRTSAHIIGDAAKLDWEYLKTEHKCLQGTVGYLSFDVDDSSWPVYQSFPWETIRFKIITFEHNDYLWGPNFRDQVREKMRNLGYVMVCGNVKYMANAFEDWFVDPNHVDLARVMKCQCYNKEATTIRSLWTS